MRLLLNDSALMASELPEHSGSSVPDLIENYRNRIL